MTRICLALVLVGLCSLSDVQARGVHERYDPYGYLSSSTFATPTPTPTSTLSSTSAGLTSATDSSSSLRRRAATSTQSSSSSSSASSTSSSAPTPTVTTLSGLEITAVEPPSSSANVTYMANAFFANWHASADSSTGSRSFGVSDLQWDLLDTVTYGYIPIPTSNFSNIALSLDDAALIPQLVDSAASYNVSTVLSFGGHISSPATGGSSSTGFALAMASDETIADFVSGVAGLVTQLGLNGVEFDWEWTPCSTETPYTSSDLSAAYLSFLQQLRSALDESVSIGLAVGVVPFQTPTAASSEAASVGGTTLTGEYKDVSPFAAVVDYITVMNFDLYGAWSTNIPVVLPNSPLNGTCTSSSPSLASALALPSNSTTNGLLPISANSAVASWALSGFRPDQIALGVSASGRSYRVAQEDALLDGEALTVYPPYSTVVATGTNSSLSDLGDEWWTADLPVNSSAVTTTASTSSSTSASFERRAATTSTVSSSSSSTSSLAPSTTTAAACVLPSTLSPISGVYTFQGLIEAGFLDSDGDVAQCQDEDQPTIIGGWDECSETPFVYNVDSGVMVSYDDAESMELKGQFILNNGLRGFQLYEAGGDSTAATLLLALRHGAGFAESNSCLPEGETDWFYAHDGVELPASTEEEETEWETVLQTEIDDMTAMLDLPTNGTATTVSIGTSTLVPIPTSDLSTTDSDVERRWVRWARHWQSY